VSEKKFSIIDRFSQFLFSLSKKNLFNRHTTTNWLGWLLSLIFFALIYATSGNKTWQVFLIIHIFFLLLLVADIYKKFKPPVELLLFLLYLIILIIKAILSAASISGKQLQQPEAMLLALQILLVCFFALNLAAIMVHNSYGKRTGLIWLSFLGLIGSSIVVNGNEYLFFFFQALLIIALLQKTRWLEELSKVECWIYIVLFFLFYRTVSGLNPFQAITFQTISGANRWYVITYILFFYFKFYLLAMLIKIPVVLIYNHASLSRKLKISGLFQSTFPQLIQFVALLLIFYSFISGWQAQNLRDSLLDRLNDIKKGSAESAISFYRIESTTDSTAYKNLKHYQPSYPLEWLSKTGVIEMKKVGALVDSSAIDYFIFSETDSNGIYFVKIDTFLLKSLVQNLHFLGGTTLDIYPLTPGKWSRYIYQANFLWQVKSQVQVFPFGALTAKTKVPLSIPLESKADTSKVDVKKMKITIAGQQQIVFGRVYLPLFEKEALSDRYLVFDIVLNFTPALLKTGLPKVILVLFIVYLLINSFVVRQVVRFGSQINETIVQKFSLLRKGIQQISSGNLDYKTKIEGEDEFVELANHFNQMGDRLKQTIAESREKDLFEYELQLAREVQLNLLPQQLPEIPGFQIAASMQTANTVGGDFYDIFPLDKNRYLFTIGDVSGKGSSAALYMAQCMSLVRFSRQFTTNPGEIGSRLNSYFAASIADRQIFVTAIIGILDTNANTLQFIRAGHTEPIFIPGDNEKEIQIIESKGIGIGLTRSTRMFEKTMKSFKTVLEPGDTFLFYTDGVIEAARPTLLSEMELYGEERLQNLLKTVREKQATEILEKIEQDVDSFYAGNTRLDDYSVLVVQSAHEI
jgi:serine phosphatase RsbU (regulator of sigma subunit)